MNNAMSLGRKESRIFVTLFFEFLDQKKKMIQVEIKSLPNSPTCVHFFHVAEIWKERTDERTDRNLCHYNVNEISLGPNNCNEILVNYHKW